jgi:hypothetical protein
MLHLALAASWGQPTQKRIDSRSAKAADGWL